MGGRDPKKGAGDQDRVEKERQEHVKQAQDKQEDKGKKSEEARQKQLNKAGGSNKKAPAVREEAGKKPREVKDETWGEKPDKKVKKKK
mmetsp:Transcript_33837/g.56800  ORF Transcript_33837/g.56800 Transcript_33837/m.56800 type:complete len:88 (+) Transcript_33837:570-833(+)|eukprot:CAMPEP_0198204396 /NCGR_PEP_ID=MMETSP1445-20131203/7804_1 /TAXON_ID=36898 /ORGANISM="Pyramimonas sp., Strain CCMP2087" /LENGTH=87 /DNA_ID=CAMNT_0043876259 /DNA_START=487 /DNA_END=750 /DNA_ORIENTATION=+